MFSFFTRRSKPSSPERPYLDLSRILTVAGMVESSPGGYSVADLAESVSDVLRYPVPIDTIKTDLKSLESNGILREDDGIWTWDVIGMGCNQAVISRLSPVNKTRENEKKEQSTPYLPNHVCTAYVISFTDVQKGDHPVINPNPFGLEDAIRYRDDMQRSGIACEVHAVTIHSSSLAVPELA